MATTNPRGKIHRIAGTGLDPGTGQSLDLDLSELTNKGTPVMADSVALIDSEAANASKKATLTNCLKILGETAAGTVTASSLSETDGVMRVNVGGTTAKTEPVAADAILLNDSEAANVNKKVTLTNLSKVTGEVFAGTEATSALKETDGVGRVSISGVTAKTVPISADSILVNDSEAANINKQVTLANVTKAIAVGLGGTVTASGLAGNATTGAMALSINGLTAKTTPIAADATAITDSADTNANKKVTLANMAAFYGALAQMPDGLKSSIFLTYAEFDAGTTDAVDTKLTDALEAKGQLIAAFGVVNELWNGTADTNVILSTAATGATAIASTIVMDNGSTQVVGSVVGAWPVTGAASLVAKDADVYAYAAADITRSTGKIGFVLIWIKTA